MSTTHQDLRIEVRQYPDQDYLGTELDAPLAAVGESVAAAYARIFTHIARERIQPAGPPFLIAAPPAGDRIHVLVGVPTATGLNGSGDLRPGRLTGGRAAVTEHRGPYDRLAMVYEDLRAWVASHGYVATGSPREVYLNDPAGVPGPADYLTEVVWPIAWRGRTDGSRGGASPERPEPDRCPRSRGGPLRVAGQDLRAARPRPTPLRGVDLMIGHGEFVVVLGCRPGRLPCAHTPSGPR